jgi:hypothetical protein
MKWRKANRRELWTIPELPFFELIVKRNPYTGKYGHWFYGDFDTFLEAAEACVAYNKKEIEQMSRRNPLFSVTKWVGNIGNGSYFANNEWKKYIWLTAGYNPHSSISNSPALRFCIDTPSENLIKFGAKIEARHTLRFLKASQEIALGLIK